MDRGSARRAPPMGLLQLLTTVCRVLVFPLAFFAALIGGDGTAHSSGPAAAHSSGTLRREDLLLTGEQGRPSSALEQGRVRRRTAHAKAGDPTTTDTGDTQHTAGRSSSPRPNQTARRILQVGSSRQEPADLEQICPNNVLW